MRQISSHSWSKETWEEQSASHHFNPAPVLLYRGQRIMAEHGLVYRAKDYLFVLSVNTSVGFCGLSEFILEDGQWQKVNEVFMQSDFDMHEPLAIYEKHGERALLNYLLQWF